jgi:hypothetical protein
VVGTRLNDTRYSVSLRIYAPIVLPDLPELARVRPTNTSQLVVGTSLLCEVFAARWLVLPPYESPRRDGILNDASDAANLPLRIRPSNVLQSLPQVVRLRTTKTWTLVAHSNPVSCLCRARSILVARNVATPRDRR